MQRIVLAAVALSIHAPGQVVSLEAQEPEKSWGAELGLSVNSSGGNERLTVITTEAGLTRLETTRYEAGLRGRVRYGRSEGEEVARNLHGSANVDLWPRRGWTPFVFVTGEQDPFRRLQLRLNTGSGMRRTFWQDGWSETSLSGAVLYSYENVDVPDTLGTGITHKARWNWRARGRRQIREGTRVQQVVFFVPAWRDFGDYQLEAQTTGRLALSESLSVMTSFLYQRDNRPAPDVRPDDWSLSVGLTLATGW